MIQTVTSEINPNQLGFVSPHEHIYLDAFETALTPELILDDPKIARSELESYQKAGGNTIVECTIHGLNPNPLGLRELSEKLALNIIAGTGLYWDRFYPAWARHLSVDQYRKLLETELTQGIAGTTVRAGIIGEIGTGNRTVSPDEANLFRAAAAAHRAIGVPITTHAPFGRAGLRQIEILEEAGADLSRVVIGHVDTVHDVDYHEQLARRGVMIQYDTIGRRDCGRDEDRAAAIVEMVRRGYARQIMMSSDVCRRGHLHFYGGFGYDHLIINFLPMLRQLGLDQATIDLLTKENPKRLFTSGS
jgi:phosphotriesterase-related protein